MKSLRDLHQRTPIDVRINVVLGAVAVVTIVTLVLAALIYPQVSTGADNTRAQLRSDAITACRATYRVEIDEADDDLEAARTRLDVAQANLEAAQAESDELVRQGLATIVTGDDTALASIASRLASSSADIAAAFDAVDAALADIEIAAAARSAAVKRYGEAIADSQDDTSRFLERCEQEGRAEHADATAPPGVAVRFTPDPPAAPTAATTTSTQPTSTAPTSPPDVVIVGPPAPAPTARPTAGTTTTSSTTPPPTQPPPQPLPCTLLGLLCPE